MNVVILKIKRNTCIQNKKDYLGQYLSPKMRTVNKNQVSIFVNDSSLCIAYNHAVCSLKVRMERKGNEKKSGQKQKEKKKEKKKIKKYNKPNYNSPNSEKEFRAPLDR